ncbi:MULTISPECIES: alanine/glycine:cation symporter family protein [unclassified Candidatus Frackibacter]|uniref:alanine/glycine:cation symporter family protein n=1 Tax=unclassified Candidatus Frackibacter TaxID=2648818 RepID=UPI00088D3931|nr:MULTISPECIES: sodium:alanine symporter family protein [unclassified Candidatus Frackibacter]SDC02757.1 alanine or glycine:cation symporter, AGCS family [Candidatus Frackibacter sp. WG11]SEM69540.1 alanine or glycine:cation symporter, AGCS family [Candidatus Frackibacter sp. WG12]SFL80789.1 alanine or glycine:cation symporter, AGCS family [Candidatus Frackibacter sp. WG13]
MEQIESLLGQLSGIVWGPILIALLVGTGIWVTFRVKWLQISKLGEAIAIIMGKYDDPEDEGEVNHFQALSAALSATIGTGNIAGVGTAIAVGGPGAVFWMWVTALFGMATKYASCLLAQEYRVVHEDGSVSGGPMYYLEKGLGQKWLATAFAIFAALASFGIGNMVQANSVAEPLQASFGVPKGVTGVLLAILVGMVIVGGIKRIGKVASKIVPFMAVVYVLGALGVLLANASEIPAALAFIFKQAFNPTAAVGGFAGAAVLQTLRMGVARGVFSNEAGLGSAPMAHAAAKTKEPVREGLVAMLGPMIDTLIVCTMTALVIVVTGAWETGQTGAELTATAFNKGLPGPGGWIVSFGIIFFAFSTAISWSYYGDRCVGYLFGQKAINIYRWIYILALPVGATVKLSLVWAIADVANGLMAFPNLIGILGLSGVVVKMTKDYFQRNKGITQEI